jgi:hypothetical protein
MAAMKSLRNFLLKPVRGACRKLQVPAPENAILMFSDDVERYISQQGISRADEFIYRTLFSQLHRVANMLAIPPI